MLHRLIRGLAALVVLGALLVGAPLALLTWVGNPWPPGGWSEVQLLTDRTICGALAVVGWLAWAQMTACILIELAAAIRGTVPTQVKFTWGTQQQLARVLVTSVVAVGIGAGTVGSSLATIAHHAVAAPPTQTMNQLTTQRSTQQTGHTEGPTLTVERHTSLWKLAETHLEDGSQWRELLDLNRGTALSDGTTLTQATQTIPAGTSFRLPAGSHLATQTPVEAPAITADGQAKDATYTVKPNDTLWDLADSKLDDPTRYMALFNASTRTVQPSGEHLVDPDHIEVGWTITIPGAAGNGRDDQPPNHRPSRHHDDGGNHGNKGDGGDEQPPDATPDVPSQPPEVQPDNPSETGDQVVDAGDQDSGDESVLDASWVLPGLTGGGALLAGGLLLGVERRRRAQFRSRRPGRAIAGAPRELAPVEMTINAAGSPTAATVTYMDEALRHLAEHTRTLQAAMPPLAAVQLGGDLVTLHLSGATDLPAPWEGSPDQLHWSCATSAPIEDLGPAAGWVEAPYPMLVTIGLGDEGDLWLLNCEEVGMLEIDGDPERGRDFVRHLAAQLAVNPWSQQVDVDCIGIAQEAVPMDDRIRYYEPGQAASRATSEVLADAVSMVDRTASHDVDVSTARTGAVDDDIWTARMLLVTADVATNEPGGTRGDPIGADPLQQLRDLISTNVGRTGTAIIVVGDAIRETASEAGAPNRPSTVIRLTEAGRVLLDQQGLDLAAVGLTSDEAHGCALLYAHSENLEDVEVPVDHGATDGWEAFVDQAGALRREYTVPRSTTADEVAGPLSSLLDGADEDYVAAAAAVAEDLDALAPKVPDRVLAEVKEADPTLDGDLADWSDPDCPRPKLTLLGPVAVHTHGRPLVKYKAICTEIVAYLALRPRNGATRDELADAMGWGDPARVRKYVDLVRHWLGEDPRTHQPYLPHASKSPATKARGVNVYQMTCGLLSDVDLFKRLRARGTHADLVRALDLVTGRPFDQLRPGGWSWLREGTAHDQVMTSAIADVAFTVVTHCLHEGELPRARAAADIAILAVPDEHVVQLCQVALTDAEGDATEARRILLENVCNLAEDGEAALDLPERTREIIRNRQWLAG